MDIYKELTEGELIDKAIHARTQGHELEAFGIVFELILQNMKLLGALAHVKDVYHKNYLQLTLFFEKHELLPFDEIMQLHLFRKYRNKIIHQIVTGWDEIEIGTLDIMFNTGKMLVGFIHHEAKERFDDDEFGQEEYRMNNDTSLYQRFNYLNNNL